MKQLLDSIYQQLLPGLRFENLNPYNPVVVHQVAQQWQLLGTGNYAAVLYYPSYPDQVVKIYADDQASHRSWRSTAAWILISPSPNVYKPGRTS